MCRVRSTKIFFKEVIVASCLSSDIFNILKMDTLFEGMSLMLIRAHHSLFLIGFGSFPIDACVDVNVVTLEGLGFLNSTRWLDVVYGLKIHPIKTEKKVPWALENDRKFSRCRRNIIHNNSYIFRKSSKRDDGS